jgi:hypothetical protein
MLRDLEKAVHQGESPFFYIFDEFEIREKGNDRYLVRFFFEINIPTKRSESSSHISLIELLISDISECGECLEFVFFCGIRSEDILGTIDEDAITCFELFDIAGFSMIGLDKSSCDPTLSMFETDTDDIVLMHNNYMILISYFTRSHGIHQSENLAHFIVFSSGFKT